MHCVLAACGTLVHIVPSLCTARAHRVITACGHDVTTCVRGAPTQQSTVMTNFWWNISMVLAALGACCLAVNSACLYTFNTLFYIK
ncbi:hypothetical protein PR001_g26669 [Phytophthora rubi]|uniref:Uncharacterized protein n=1 Tax=Phytophthora rubi TaxID=129364 RepID=A0A6A3HS31_9STRA|nr:hypothetical protein PR002_g29576 [Phytophthora rubi]KAE8972227.1 hypothetical protein PR001_g26669 [Phytophthora rubi]